MTKAASRAPEALTEGAILPKLFRFVLPLVLTNLLQMLYSAADMMVVGLSGVEGAIGAIGTTGAYINLLLNLFIGFSVGANVVVARLIGAKDEGGAQKATHTAVLLAIAAGILCGGIGLVCSRTVLHFLGDEGHILDLATKYTIIYFCGAPFLATVNMLIAVFRAKGDTRTPLIVLSASGLMNLLLNLFFVLVCRMSVDGVAYATVIANFAAMLGLGGRLMAVNDPYTRLSLRALRFDGAAAKQIAAMGLPAGVQGALFSLSNMLIQSSIISINNRLYPGGSVVIDGNAAGGSLEGFIYTATNAVYQAAVTFTSQHLGAGKLKRIYRVMGCCYLVTGCISMLGTGILYGFGRPLLGLYLQSEESIAVGMIRMRIMILPYISLAFMETGSGILRGLGRSMTSTVVSLVGSCLLRIVWIYTIFRAFPTLEVIYLSYPVSWALTAATHFVCSQIVLRRQIRGATA